MSLAAYLPIDRYNTLLHNQTISDRVKGAALFADISGFTPLTEILARELGARRGCEELTIHLNTVYDALINQVHLYKGTVLSFSGDAITCWFEGEEHHAAHRAVTVALGMQEAMQKLRQVMTPQGQVLNLALKVAVAAGPARRFMVGSPELQYLDILAGATLDRLARAEHLAVKGEVVVSREVWDSLGNLLEVDGWREDPETQELFVSVKDLQETASPQGWPEETEDQLTPDRLKSWILPRIYERVQTGIGDFLTELRPVTAMFVHFTGVDYDTDDEAGQKLDAFIRWAQQTVESFQGSLLQVTIGDKGSYLCVAFGAPVAYKNDSERAVRAAQILLTPPPSLDWLRQIQIGISSGTIRAGAYGSTVRHTYGIIGEDVNLAARLMQAADSGRLLVTEKVKEATNAQFTWESLSPIRVKGKSEPLKVYQLSAKHEKLPGPGESLYSLPFLGRKEELEQAQQKLDLVLQSKGQIIAITAEAGMGKSRLIAEIVRNAKKRGLVAYQGECQSYATNSSYFVWHNIWQEFFHLDPVRAPEGLLTKLKQELLEIDPNLVSRLPLLGPALNISIGDNELTRSLDPKLRKTSLESLLADCIQARSRNTPLLLVLEDCHWLDPLSHDLLEVLGRSIYDLPVMVIIAYRPPELEHLKAPRITYLPNCITFELKDFTAEEAAQLISLKLEQLGANAVELSSTLLDRIMSRAQGNPFYIEELLNYLRDKGLKPGDLNTWEELELPTSLHSLVLSRIDQLTETQKITIKVASIIGRIFLESWLWGTLPTIGNPERVRADLEKLSKIELTPLEKIEPELTYLFKHVIMREVAYESIPFSTRAQLHEHLAHFIEQTHPDHLAQYIDLLAYHFYLSNNKAKKCEYLRKAGENAQAEFANQAAIDYYQRLLPLLSLPEQPEILIKLGRVLELVGEWNEADILYQQGLEIARQSQDLALEANCLSAIGGLLVRQKRYTEAEPQLELALEAYKNLNDAAGLSQTMTEIGEVYRLQGNYVEARAKYSESLRLAQGVTEVRLRQAARAKALKAAGTASNQLGDSDRAKQFYEESLSILRELGDRPGIASILNNLGIVARHQSDYEAAGKLYQASLDQFREIGDRWAQGQLLNNLGLVARYKGDNIAARSYLEGSLEIQRRLGDKWGIANVLSSLGDIILDTVNISAAEAPLKESLLLNQELDNRTGIAYVLEYLSGYASANSQATRALTLAGAAASIREKIGAPLSRAEQSLLNKRLLPAYALLEDDADEVIRKGCAMSPEEAIQFALDPRD